MNYVDNIQIELLRSLEILQQRMTLHTLAPFFFVMKGPAADATDAPQP
jgi:hypothetical protein